MSYDRWCATTVQCAQQLLTAIDTLLDTYIDVLLWRIIAALRPSAPGTSSKEIDRFYRRQLCLDICLSMAVTTAVSMALTRVFVGGSDELASWAVGGVPMMFISHLSCYGDEK
jgi:hypothetical protein